MQSVDKSVDMLLDTTREFLHQIAAFLPRLLLALMVVPSGGCSPRRCASRWSVGWRAVNFTC